MKDENDLIENIEKLHTTPMGVDRIRCNLSLGEDVGDVVAWCRKRILDDSAIITRRGKTGTLQLMIVSLP